MNGSGAPSKVQGWGRTAGGGPAAMFASAYSSVVPLRAWPTDVLAPGRTPPYAATLTHSSTMSMGTQDGRPSTVFPGTATWVVAPTFGRSSA